MQLLNQSIEFRFVGGFRPTEKDLGLFTEEIGRTCWKSEGKACEGSWKGFNERILARNHASVIEHYSITAKIITDRAIANELVRHRIAAYTQESTRYVDYEKAGHCKFIIPLRFKHLIEPGEYKERKLKEKTEKEEFDLWHYLQYLFTCERMYNFERADGVTPEHARDVLPLCTATELWATFNLRMWRHVINMRTARAAHPKIRELVSLAHTQLAEWYPTYFKTTDTWPTQR